MSIKPQLPFVPQHKSFTSTSKQIDDTGNQGYVYYFSKGENHDSWIIDSGAADHMTFDPHDLYESTQQKKDIHFQC